MSFVQNIIDGTGAETTDEQIEQACMSLCTTLKRKRDVARQMKLISQRGEAAKDALNVARDSIRSLNLGIFAI